MSTTAVKGVSAGDIRRMLELVSEVSREPGNLSHRMGVVLARLGEMASADLAVVARVKREVGKPLQVQALIEHGCVPSKLGDANDRPHGTSECISSIVPLKETGHYACLALHRCTMGAESFTQREKHLVDFVWQSLGFLHEQTWDVA